MPNPLRLSTWGPLCAVVYIVFGLAILGLTGPTQVALMWPPAGIGYALVLVFGRRAWLWLLIAVTVFQALSSTPLLFAPFSILSNLVPTLLAAELVQRYSPGAPEWLGPRAGLSLLRASVAMVVASALIGVFGMWISGMLPGADVVPAIARWAMADLLGVIAFTPSVLVLWGLLAPSGRSSLHLAYASSREQLVWLGFFVLTLGMTVWIRDVRSGFALALCSLPMGLLIWSALRFAPAWTLIGTTVMGLFVSVLVGQGVGPFSPPASLVETAVLIAFLCLSLIVPQMLVAAEFENRVSNLRLLRRANTDALTRLPNRPAFEAVVQQALADGERELTLGYLDVDQFKLINDTVSHAVGDELLRQLSGVIKAVLEPGDLLARVGGDEFILLFRRCPPERANERGQRILDAIASFRFPWKDQLFSITASLGLVPVPPGEDDYAALYAMLDSACYTAKDQGGNRVHISDRDDPLVTQRAAAMRWAVRLTDAIDQQRFQFYCQSIVPLRGQESTRRHVELLLRIYDPERGEVLLPSPFIVAAERFRLGVRLDRYVLDNGLGWFEDRPEAAESLELVGLNLSAAAVEDSEFARYIERRIAASKLPPSRICFEMTETNALRDLARAQRFIQTVRGMGCKFALDDFGSGFCSFSYLRSLSVDFFKIDGGFVRDLSTSPLALAIVRSIADIARVSQAQTIAEWVESDDLRARLAALEVDFAQGWAIDRPMPLKSYFKVAA